MPHDSLQSYLDRRPRQLSRGPIALYFIEDSIEVDSALHHLLARGFATVLAFLPEGLTLDLPAAHRETVVPLRHPVRARGAITRAVNQVIEAAAGQWIHYGFNAEYLFYPFCETRSVRELLSFHAEERRDAMLTFVADLYASDLDRAPSGVSLDDAHLDAMGYFADARRDPDTGHPRERQLDFFGGVRWRFEQHIPPASRRIDRVGLFRARPGLRLLEDHRLNDEEMNTYACPWHHNLSAAVASFRTAKALRANPGSAQDVTRFRWSGSVPFRWSSQQLMELGLMEPGQWF